MIDFVPIQSYTTIFYHIMLCVVLFTFLHTQALSIESPINKWYIKHIGVILLFFLLGYMGLRPIHSVFIDMTVYAKIFERYQDGFPITDFTDLGFHLYVLLMSKVGNAELFFFICTVLYVVPIYIVCKKWFKKYWFYGFLFLVISFTFWSYGVNGIRNGIAGSLFLFGLSRDKRLFQILLIILAIGFHKSMMLPAIGYILVQFYNNPKGYIILWVLCIPLSLAAGGFWETFFASLGFEDKRLSYLVTKAESESFSRTGFRWDFLLYSASAVFAGWYYIFKKKYYDKSYFWLFNIYLFANAFWILVIRANFSNRFAYLSWFMLGLILIYPLLKERLIKKQHKKIGIILLAYFIFTYFMNVFLNQ